jgi:hypothetical protein
MSEKLIFLKPKMRKNGSVFVTLREWAAYIPYRPGDKNQLKAQDVTAKLVRFDILRKVPKNNLFCIKLT